MNPLNTPLPAQAKAVLAAIIAGLSALLPLLSDGFAWADGITALVAALVAYIAVFETPNAEPRHDGEQDQEDGYRGRHRDVDPRSVLGLPADDDHDL